MTPGPGRLAGWRQALARWSEKGMAPLPSRKACHLSAVPRRMSGRRASRNPRQ